MPFTASTGLLWEALRAKQINQWQQLIGEPINRALRGIESAPSLEGEREEISLVARGNCLLMSSVQRNEKLDVDPPGPSKGRWCNPDIKNEGSMVQNLLKDKCACS